MSERPLAVPGAEERELLRLASVDNFRDVAGPGRGYATRRGARVRTGVFFRSNDLRLAEEDHATIADLGLRAILDLRSDVEISLHPDPDVPGAEALHFDAIGIPIERLSTLSTRAEAIALMDEVYRGFVVEEHCRTAFGGVLRQLATGGPQLFHCSQGKDRTGWVAALLLHIAGVDDPTIESDYLLTNALTATSRGRVEAQIEQSGGPDLLDVYEPTLIVDVEYLDAAWTAIDELYGDRSAYLREGLGLDDSVIAALRELLLAD